MVATVVSRVTACVILGDDDRPERYRTRSQKDREMTKKIMTQTQIERASEQKRETQTTYSTSIQYCTVLVRTVGLPVGSR
jgi:hypothetical protein